MKTLLAILVLLASSALAQTPAAAPSTTTAPQEQPRSPPLTREQIESIRTELRAGKSDLIAKNIPLTTSEAAAFWPLYKQYEAAAKTINDKRFDLLMQFLDAGEKADPALTTKLVKTSLKRDVDLAQLRMTWAPRFAKVLPKAKAARFLQVDRALTLVADAKLASMMPLFPWYPWPPLEE
jgi:Spy/CpxP family protein refolding chaperone